jgi:hypothetical protein
MRAMASIAGILLIAFIAPPLCVPKQSNQSTQPHAIKKLLKQAFEAAIQEDDPEAREYALKKILSLEVSIGEGTLAAQQVSYVNNPMFLNDVVCEVAAALVRKGDSQTILENLKASRDESAANECLREIATAQAESGDADSAYESAKHEHDLLQRTVALGDAAASASDSGKTDAANKLFEIEIETARSVQNEPERVDALRMVAYAMAHSGRASDISSILPEMEELVAKSTVKSEDKDNLLSFLSEAQAIGGNFGKANQTADLIQKQDLRDIAHLNVSQEQLKAGDFSGAINSIRTVQSDSERSSWLAFAAGKEADSGDYPEAFRLVAEMPDQNFADSAYSGIALGQAKRGKIEEACRTARLIESDSTKARTLITIGADAPMPDKNHMATAIFNEAKTFALRIEESYFRAAALSHLAGVLSARGEWTLARQAADAINLDGPEESAMGDILKHRAHALENIAYWQCKMGSCKEALDWATSESVPFLRSLALVGVVEAMLGQKPPLDHNWEEGYG